MNKLLAIVFALVIAFSLLSPPKVNPGCHSAYRFDACTCNPCN